MCFHSRVLKISRTFAFPATALKNRRLRKIKKFPKKFRNRGLGTVSVPSADAVKFPGDFFVFPSVFHSGEGKAKVVLITSYKNHTSSHRIYMLTKAFCKNMRAVILFGIGMVIKIVMLHRFYCRLY